MKGCLGFRDPVWLLLVIGCEEGSGSNGRECEGTYSRAWFIMYLSDELVFKCNKEEYEEWFASCNFWMNNVLI